MRRSRLRGTGAEMSFRTADFSPGVLLPEELALIEQVYDTVAAKDWFTKDEARRREFAAYVIATYNRGMVDPSKLLRLCEMTAGRKFRRSTEA